VAAGLPLVIRPGGYYLLNNYQASEEPKEQEKALKTIRSK